MQANTSAKDIVYYGIPLLAIIVVYLGQVIL
jgi:hypothetical protein